MLKGRKEVPPKEDPLKKMMIPVLVLLVSAVCLGTSSVRAQKGDFRGLPWGASKEDVRKAEGDKTIDQSTISLGAVPLSMILRDPGLECLVYMGKVSDLDCVVAFYFAGDKLVQGRIIFTVKHSDANLTIDDFQKVKVSLIEGWGNPEEDESLWSDERYKNDRTQWGKAVVEGHLAYHALWRLPDTVVMLQLSGVNHEPLHGLQYESAMKEHLDLAREARAKARSQIR